MLLWPKDMRRLPKIFCGLLTVSCIVVLGVYLNLSYIFSSTINGRNARRLSPNNLNVWQENQNGFNIEMRRRVKNMQEACINLQSNGSKFSSIEKTKLDHLVVDDRYKVLYCYVPKVACTNLKRVFLLLTGKMNSTDPLDLSAADVHGRFDKHLRYLDELPAAGVKYRLKNYKKVLFVRDPLERLLSAYRNKFLQKGNDYFKEKFGRKIVKLYRENPSEKSLTNGHDVQFPEFVQYFLDLSSKQHEYNEHWAPIFDLCHPCHVKYNFIGKYETIDEDVNGLLRILHVDHMIHFPERGDSYKAKKTEDTLDKFYRDISVSSVQGIIDVYRNDYAAFDYKIPQQ